MLYNIIIQRRKHMIAEKKEITINGVECQEQCKADSKGSLKVVDKE